MNRCVSPPPKQHQFCVFEHVYFSRPDSLVFGRPVDRSREMLGRLLAREQPADADLSCRCRIPACPRRSAMRSNPGLPFRMGLIRNHYIGRTFIEPEQAIRDFGVKLKLNPVRALLEGKRVVLVDDSIVRGTTSRKIVRMVREAGATEMHMRISCPPTISPCYYGIDTPTREELLAADASVIRPRLTEGGRRRSFRRARHSKRFACSSMPIRWAIFRWKACAGPLATRTAASALPATPALSPRKRAARSSRSGAASRADVWRARRKERTVSEVPAALAAEQSRLKVCRCRTRAGTPDKTISARRLVRELLSWVWVALAFLLITGTMVQARVIPSESMESTLLVGDHLLMSRIGYDVGVPFTPLSHPPLARTAPPASDHLSRADPRRRTKISSSG